MATTFYATNNFTGDGTTVNWNINFADGYIDTTNVKARYLDNAGSYVDIAISSVAGNVVTISPAVANGQEFQIYRDTEKRFPLVDFSDGAILNETNLDTLATQAVMVSAEAFDQSNNGVRIAGDSLVIAQGIDAKAQLALDNSDVAVATANAIDGKAQTALDSSAAAVVTANAATSTAAGAVATANTALATANDAADDAATAITTANGAVTTANAATVTANAASASASAATTTANNAANAAATAVSTAGTALSTANTASTNASAAVVTANGAKTTAEGIEAKADSALAASATAVSTANSAEATANAIDGKATDALDTADAAVTTANSALSTAQGAETAANNASSTVDAIANTKANKGANSDITSLSGLTTALSVAQGGTGSSTIAGARASLQVDRVEQDTNETRLATQNKNYQLTLTNAGTWGLYRNGVGWRALGIEQGGTGAVTAAAALTALGGVAGEAVRAYIRGFNIQCTTNQVTVGPGEANINGVVRRSTGDLVVSTGTLTVNAWYHVYLYWGGSSVAAEIVSTPPTVAAYPAFTKQGDTSRRYIGSIRTDAAGALIPQISIDGLTTYLVDASANARLVAGGVATTATVFSAASRAYNDNTLSLRLACGNGSKMADVSSLAVWSLGGTSRNGTLVSADTRVVQDIPCTNPSVCYYQMTLTPSQAAAFIDLVGYSYAR